MLVVKQPIYKLFLGTQTPCMYHTPHTHTTHHTPTPHITHRTSHIAHRTSHIAHRTSITLHHYTIHHTPYTILTPHHTPYSLHTTHHSLHTTHHSLHTTHHTHHTYSTPATLIPAPSGCGPYLCVRSVGVRACSGVWCAVGSWRRSMWMWSTNFSFVIHNYMSFNLQVSISHSTIMSSLWFVDCLREGVVRLSVLF
jgi:hypothetical protein